MRKLLVMCSNVFCPLDIRSSNQMCCICGDADLCMTWFLSLLQRPGRGSQKQGEAEQDSSRGETKTEERRATQAAGQGRRRRKDRQIERNVELLNLIRCIPMFDVALFEMTIITKTFKDSHAHMCIRVVPRVLCSLCRTRLLACTYYRPHTFSVG